MENSFWLGKWQNNTIGFHQSDVHAFLRQYWTKFQTKHDSSKAQQIFVPLCGKSLDMLWLWRQGCHVQGIELSKIAVESFFNENNLTFEIQAENSLWLYKHQNLQIWQGDFWDLEAQHLGHIDIIYDRGALIALPKAMRQPYAEHLQQSALQATIFLISIEYETGLFAGPPFCVNEVEIQELYGKNYAITMLAERKSEVKEFPVNEKFYEMKRFVS